MMKTGGSEVGEKKVKQIDTRKIEAAAGPCLYSRGYPRDAIEPLNPPAHGKWGKNFKEHIRPSRPTKQVQIKQTGKKDRPAQNHCPQY